MSGILKVSLIQVPPPPPVLPTPEWFSTIYDLDFAERYPANKRAAKL